MEVISSATTKKKGGIAMEQRTELYENHSKINKVVHNYKGVSDWDKIIEKIIINHLKASKRLD